MKQLFEKSWFRTLGFFLLIFIGTLVFMQAFAEVSFRYGSLSFNINTRITPAGGTVISVPPVGELFLKTHLTPWQLVITLNEVDFQKLEKQLDSLPLKNDWINIFEKQALKAIISLFAIVLLTGIAGGALMLVILRIYPTSRLFWYGVTTSVLVISLLIGTTVFTYDPHALEHPQYRGVLASAPWVMNLISMGLDNIEVIGNNLGKISRDLPNLYKQAGEIKNLGNPQTDLAILHVSDIHNNPAAFDFIAELVTNFKIKFVIDTGDITDYGTPLEAKVLQEFKKIKIPYVFIPGNHETPLIVKYMKKIRHVKVLTKGTLKVAGLLIAGQADPASLNISSDVAPEAEMEIYKNNFTKFIGGLNQTPEIIAVHNRFLASDLIGKYPLILHGHDHKYDLSVFRNSIVDDAGTTGAAGLRGLTDEGVPYSATILYWKKDQNGKFKLHAADSININGIEGQLTINRHTFDENSHTNENE